MDLGTAYLVAGLGVLSATASIVIIVFLYQLSKSLKEDGLGE